MDKWFFAQQIQPEDLGHGAVRRVLAHSETLMIVEVRCETGAAAPRHAHPNEQETYILSGAFEYDNGGEMRVLHAGDSVRIAPDVPHTSRCLQKGSFLDIFTPARADFLKK